LVSIAHGASVVPFHDSKIVLERVQGASGHLTGPVPL
jgi:hypothetical protein